MKIPAVSLLAGAVLLAGCQKKSEPSKPQATNFSSGNPITAPVDYLGAIAKAQKSAVSTLDLVQINKAIETFSAEEGRLPRDLKELVAKQYLAKLPAPPYGLRYAYNPQNGQVRLVRQPQAPPAQGR